MASINRVPATLIIVLLVCGCAGTPARKASTTAGEILLDGRVMVTQARIEQEGDNKMCLVRLKNLTNEEMQINYRVEWQDASGAKVRRDAGMISLRLGRGEEVEIKSQAPMELCERFTLEVHE